MYRFDWAAKWGQYSPGKIAIKEYESGRTITYKELNNVANHLSAELERKFALGKGDRIAILAENSLEQFILFTVAQKVGIILVPLNFRLTAREIDFLLNDSQSSLVIADEKFMETVNECQAKSNSKKWSMEALREWGDTVRNKPYDYQNHVDIVENDPVFILYTSGTTGFPKGALYTHKMLFWNSTNTTMRLDLTSEDRTITCLPLFHTGGWNVLSTPFLHRGAYFCLTQKFDPDEILRLMESEATTVFMGVPTMLKMMADSPEFATVKLDKTRFFIVGGEALPLPLIDKWHQKGVPIRQGYGLTEVGPNITSLHQDAAKSKMGSIGVPNFYVDVKIIGDDGKTVKTGEAGELLLRGPMTTPGYWNNPEATAKSLQNGWFYTGDVVKRDKDEFIYVVDRKKNMYISGGENVYPAEVEEFLFAHPEIDDVAVIGIPDEKWGEVGKAFIVCEKGSQLTEEDVLNFCKTGLAKFKIPRYVQFLKALPKGDTGKIDRKKLLNQ